MSPKRIVVGISGATGAIYGIRLLEVLQGLTQVEMHLVISETAREIIPEETDWSVAQVEALATRVYDNQDLGAALSSGSFQTEGMIIAPCSIKTLGAIANSLSSNLLVRAADVTLKERRRLVLVVRETPLHLGHLRRMAEVTEAGAIILPPMPAFYHHPKTLDDIVNHTVGRVLDQFHLEHRLFERWGGLPSRAADRLPGS